MSDDRPIPARRPHICEEEAGDRYWCTCGRSQNQPFCDGAHKGTSYAPMKVTIEESGRVAWCTCKRTGNAPYCDGAHRDLPE